MKVLIVYDSESGNTEAMAHAVSEGVEDEGINVEIKRVDEASIDDLPMFYGRISKEMTFNGSPHPALQRT